MKVIGYARTTIIDKESSEQLNKLKKFGCTELFHETYAYEENCDNHSLESVIARMQSGETLVVSELHRLGKTTRQLTELTDLLRKRNLHLVSLAENIDTREPMGAIYFNLMEGLAAMEQALIKERTLVGLNNARKNGKIGGRPKIDPKTIKKIRQLYYDKKETIQFISTKCGVSVGTCYKYIKLSEEELDKVYSH
ncbi:recombinase family protein [Enterococcus gallinarum]|uniref:recombinase family protein n=1 Tax=Enterococcus gallinarum TaxID=1353 RepID=UPI00115D957B|nr:recombinase family protein [Enterococcus gallinarum]MCD5077457.1 recombinase family protein [Enterococcus gallinarum]TXT68729.1 recombinase family protein [Enterococcus gallinarum]